MKEGFRDASTFTTGLPVKIHVLQKCETAEHRSDLSHTMYFYLFGLFEKPGNDKVPENSEIKHSLGQNVYLWLFQHYRPLGVVAIWKMLSELF